MGTQKDRTPVFVLAVMAGIICPTLPLSAGESDHQGGRSAAHFSSIDSFPAGGLDGNDLLRLQAGGNDCNNDGIPDDVQLASRLIGTGYGATEIDTSSGAQTLFSGLSADGVADLQCLTFDPNSGYFYGILWSGFLVRIELATGQISIIGLIDEFQTTGACAFDANTSTLYGIGRAIPTSDYYLYEVDAATADTTVIGPSVNLYTLAFDPNTGVLWGTTISDLVQVDTGNGQITTVGPIGYTPYGLTFDPNSNTLYGHTFSGGPGGGNRLLKIDTTTGQGTSLGQTDCRVSGLAFDPTTDNLYATYENLNQLGPACDAQLFTIDPVTMETASVFPLEFALTSLALDATKDVLYGLAWNYDGLVSIDQSTGEISAVGEVGFDVDISYSGLAYDPVADRLYTIDSDESFPSSWDLLAINPLTAQTTSLGQIDRNAKALAFDPNTNTLYGVHEGTILYSLDVATLQRTDIGTPTLDGSSIGIHGMTYDANTETLYGFVTDGLFGHGGLLVTIDTSTAVATLVVRSAFYRVEGATFDAANNRIMVVDAGGSTEPLQSLGWIDLETHACTLTKRLFVATSALTFDPTTDTTYSIFNVGPNGAVGDAWWLLRLDAWDGKSTTIGPMHEDADNIQSLAYDPVAKRLYAVAVSTDELLAIDPTTGQSSVIGPIGTSHIIALAYDPISRTLYGGDFLTSSLMKIDTNTGEGNVIGATGIGGLYGLAYEPCAGVIYGSMPYGNGGSFDHALVTLDPDTGQATVVGPLGFGGRAGLAVVSGDCNLDFTLDVCQLEAGDANNNGVLDVCEVQDVCQSPCPDLACECAMAPQIGSGFFAADQGDCLQSSDGGALMCLQAGDLPQDETLTMTQTATDVHDVDLTVGATAGLGTALATYDVDPAGLVLDSPVTVTTVHDVSAYNANQRNRIDVYAWDGAGMSYEPLGAWCCVNENPPCVFTATCTFALDQFAEIAPVVPEDSDGDGVFDLFGGTVDNCPSVANADQSDADVNGVGDCCDGGWAGFVDGNGNGVHDPCEPESPVLAGPPHDILKNRYISIDPRGLNQLNVDRSFDIRLTLSSTQVNGVTAVGSSWWANTPDADCISVVGPTRPATPPNWDCCPTLHLSGCPVIPTSTYEIVAVVGPVVSDPPLLAATQAKPGTKWWGDAVGNFNGTEWTPPQGVTNIDDALAAIKTWQGPGSQSATHVSVTDIHPNLNGTQINKVVNFDDVFQFILAFQGNEYPGTDLDLCIDP